MPVDNWVRVFCRLACVLDSAFSAERERCYSGLLMTSGVSPFCLCACTRLLFFFGGPAVRLRFVEKEVVLDKHSIGHL